MSYDKYEAFKEWYHNSEYSNYNNISTLFEEFEASLEDNMRNEKLKEELLNAILKCGTKGCTVDKIIEVLTEGDYLK